MKLMIIDGNSILNRAFYGIRGLTTASGTPTNAIFGFLNIMHKLCTELAPDALCVAFDLKAPTFRHKMYDAYKATRTGMPEELAAQLPYIKKILDAMNIPRYELEGFEADDIIGTVSRRCEAVGWECLAVTGDRDSLQLITDKTHIELISSRPGSSDYTEYDRNVFFDKYGFEPINLIDCKALMGDSSDNIPGVAGVGEKTATELIGKFATLSAVYDAIGSGEIKASVEKKLEAGRENAELSYKLATIDTAIPLDFSPEANLRREPDNDELYSLFMELEFNKFMDKFGVKPPESGVPVREAESVPSDYDTVSDLSVLDRALAAESVFIWFGDGDEAFFRCGGNSWLLSRDKFSGDYNAALERLFSRPDKCGWNVKDVQRRLLELSVPLTPWRFDAALAVYLLNPSEGNFSIEQSAAKYCALRLGEAGGENVQLSMLDAEKDGENGAQRAFALEALYPVLSAKLEEAGMTSLLCDMELPLSTVLAEMEHKGCLLDKNALMSFGKMLSEKIEFFEEQIYAIAGKKFNINSTKQLGALLFDELGLPHVSKTKSGYSTNIEVLEKLLGKHDIIEYIIEYRRFTKLKSTYADGLLKEIKPDGRIHTKFNMTATATGRLSSAEPNLQNIPVRTELGGEFRKMFVAPEGWLLVDADYSQIELRLLAHISGDENMIKAFAEGRDIHRSTASEVFGVPLEDVTPLQRSRAKAVNFGIVYGISEFSLSQDLRISRAEAKQYIDSYLETYSGVRQYMADIVEKAKRDGYVSTLFGRRRYLPELESRNRNIRTFAERVALNMPIQGTAADIMKLAMINVSRRFSDENMRARLILQIHDELIAECPAEEAEKAKEILIEEMEGAARLSVKLLTEAGIGKDWRSAK